MNEQAIPVVGQPPESLHALMQSWVDKARPEMTHLILISISVLPYGEAAPEFWVDLNKVLVQCRDRNEGSIYDLSESERALLFRMNDIRELSISTDLRVNLLRLIQRYFPDHFGMVDQTRLLRIVNLFKRLPNAIALVARFVGHGAAASAGGGLSAATATPAAQAAAPGLGGPAASVTKDIKPARTRSLHINDIKLVEDLSRELGPHSFSRAFIRSQELAEITPGQKPVHIMSEYYASMDMLRRHALKGVEMRGSGNLFNQLTILLDQSVLISFKDSNPEGMPCSLNMNVESVFTRGFEEFFNTTDPTILSNITFEFRQANIIQNFDEFAVACELIRSRGGKIAVDAIFPETIGLVNLHRLKIEIAKVFWRQNAESVLPGCRDDIRIQQEGGVRFAFARVDDQLALDIGQELGVTLFQGFYVDRLLSNLKPAVA